MGKTIMIVGATSGIGAECARQYGEDEDNILFLVGRDSTKLSKLGEKIKCEKHDVLYDFENIDDIAQVFDQVKELKLHLDGLIYCVGMDDLTPVKALSPRKTELVMKVNAIAFIILCRYFYSKSVSADGASIVAISSIASRLNAPGMAAYAASKSALNSFVKTAAKEFLRRSIRVNAILPAGVNTKMAEEKGQLMQGLASNSSELHESLGMMSTQDVYHMVEYLISDKSKFVTGALLEINAGN